MSTDNPKSPVDRGFFVPGDPGESRGSHPISGEPAGEQDAKIGVHRFCSPSMLTGRCLVADIKPSDAPRPHEAASHARLEAKDMPDLLVKIEACGGTSYTQLAVN